MKTCHFPMFLEAAGLQMDFRRMDLPQNLHVIHGSILDAAVAQMLDIERGERVNTHEDRQVGHYWLRNPDLAPTTEASAIRQSWQRLQCFADEQLAENPRHFDAVLWIGIGGSALGPQMLHHTLRDAASRPRMFFFDNTDPAGFQRTLGEIATYCGLAKTLVVVVSKSGATMETTIGMLAAQQAFSLAGLSFEKHAVAITLKNSRLDQAAMSWMDRFEIWDWVGGRTSLFSTVGLLPTIISGAPWRDLLAGAKAMDDATRERSVSENAALALALAWHYQVQARGLRNMVVLPYSDRLELMPRYLQQLVMESLGKSGQGTTVYGNKGATDQHAFVQQLREGTADFFVTFVRVLDGGNWDIDVVDARTAGDYLWAFQEGTARALSEAGRYSLRVTMESISAFSLGALVALYERAVGYYAALIGVNAYHQPGVEAGKKAADAVLDVQAAVLANLCRKSSGQTVRQLAKESDADVDLVYDILCRLALLKRHGVKQVQSGNSPAECVFGSH